MYAENDELSDRYHGYNPEFLRKVWAKRNPARGKAAKLPSVKEMLIAARKEREEKEKHEVEATIAKYKTHDIIGCRPSAREIIMRVARWRGVQYEAILGTQRV